jgi:hypothetical protein
MHSGARWKQTEMRRHDPPFRSSRAGYGAGLGPRSESGPGLPGRTRRLITPLLSWSRAGTRFAVGDAVETNDMASAGAVEQREWDAGDGRTGASAAGVARRFSLRPGLIKRFVRAPAANEATDAEKPPAKRPYAPVIRYSIAPIVSRAMRARALICLFRASPSAVKPPCFRAFRLPLGAPPPAPCIRQTA